MSTKIRFPAENLLRLFLLGALNWAKTWYKSGRMTPGEIAEEFVCMLKGYPNT
jgi:hypothetical protein